MNETTLVKGISAIGSMDGPTSVFLAGKLSVGVVCGCDSNRYFNWIFRLEAGESGCGIPGISDWSRSGSWNLCISGN